MSREALVVGINNYQDPGLQQLKTPANDAEAIAQCLRQYGDFQVIERLPTVYNPLKNNALQVAANEQVTKKQLKQALEKLFTPDKTKNIPDTALFFFSGHGLRDTGAVVEGYLAPSNSNPDDEEYGLQLGWLRKLLEQSPVKQQIVWLDCCHSGEFINDFEKSLQEAKPDGQENRERCFIAACRDFEKTSDGIKHGVLTEILLKGLNPANRPDGWVTTYTLAEFIEQAQPETQRIVPYNSGNAAIDLTTNRPRAKPVDPNQENVCPYKGLEYFNEKDAHNGFFHGRTALTDNLIKKVDTQNFVAVSGSSGSGKSSVVRAGLLHELKRGQKRGGSNKWKIYPLFTPREHPLESLKRVIGKEADELQQLIAAADAERVVLVVDQFEESFTLCQDDKERQQFFDCLLDALERTGQKLCLVLAMRADFLGKCAEYTRLYNKIREEKNLIIVGSMKEGELEDAIKKPAFQVGLRLEENLVKQLINDVGDSPNSLPLLQYTLEELWKARRGLEKTNNWLILDSYHQLGGNQGGINGILEKQADRVYDSLKEKQCVAQRIFLELTQLGEVADTRRRVRKKDLINSQHSETLLNEVIEELIKARLITTTDARLIDNTNEGKSPDSQLTQTDALNPSQPQDDTVLEITHEALIRYWNKLRTWLQKYRVHGEIQRKIEAAAKEWEEKGKSEGSLLQGDRLVEAEDYQQKYGHLGFLNETALTFIEESQKLRDRQEQETLETILDATIAYSQFLFTSNKKLDALVHLIKTGKQQQKNLERHEFSRLRFLVMLGQVFSELAEYNSIDAYEYDEVTSVAWSPDNQIVASASSRGIIKIWSADGTPIDELNGDQGAISDLTFSSDGKFLASASSDLNYRTIQLWEISISNKDTKNKKEVTFSKTHRLEGHRDEVNSISFRPGDVNSNLEDEIILASASQDGTVKLWSQKGILVKTLEGHKHPVKCVAFSPDGKMIASGDSDGVVIIWSCDRNLLHRIDKESAGEQIHTKSVTSINFSPDGKILVSSGRDKLIKFWDMNGEFIDELYEQEREVLYVTFSLDGRLMASTDIDGNIKLWFENEKLWSQESKLLRALKHEKAVPKVSFSKDGKKLLSCSHDKTIRFWNCCSKFDGYDNGKFKGHTDWIKSIKFNVSDKSITTASEDKTVNVWNYDGKLLPSYSHHNNETYPEVKSSQNGEIVAISHDDNMRATVERNENSYEIKLENFRDSQLKKRISSAKFPILGLKFSQCDKTIILISGDYIELWKSDDLSKAKSIQLNIEKDNGDIRAASLSSDWSKIAVAYYGKKDGYQNKKINRIRLWNLDLKEALKEAELYVQSY